MRRSDIFFNAFYNFFNFKVFTARIIHLAFLLAYYICIIIYTFFLQCLL